MDKPPINIVWLKRDLRTQDHAPLQQAEQDGLPYLVIYLYEPTLIQYPDTSDRHLQFVYHSTQVMNTVWKSVQREVHLFYGDAIDVFGFFIEKYDLKKVFSHQETGTQITYDRDKAVAQLFKKYKIDWLESPTNGVVRGITNRDGWDKQWYATMYSKPIQNTYNLPEPELLGHDFLLPFSFLKRIKDYSDLYQPAGEVNGWKYLRSFTQRRGFNYHRFISKPTQSRSSCGRVSPFLTWGNLSIRQVYQYVKDHPNFRSNKRAFMGFLDRLKWHCHFIQKFEVECAYETHCINRGYELLERTLNEDFITAWKTGTTGFPLIDACMRCVIATGWINFRMRAMLVSFLCHHLFQDWRSGVYHLAQQFLDYEPGIHYPQFQMQAGTTGVNTIRMYNPTKQAQDHDPEGVYIRKWIPELRNIPQQYIHEPWKMTLLEQGFAGIEIGKDYPKPIIDLKKSGRIAREAIWGHRKNKVVQQEKQRILDTHTRRGQFS